MRWGEQIEGNKSDQLHCTIDLLAAAGGDDGDGKRGAEMTRTKMVGKERRGRTRKGD